MTIRFLTHAMSVFLAIAILLTATAVAVRAEEAPKAGDTAQPIDPAKVKYIQEPTQTMEEGKDPAQEKTQAMPRTVSDINEAGLKKVLEKLPAGSRHQPLMVPMRDGVKLATDVFLPPEGDGPWPTALLRTQYSRWDPRPMTPLAGTPCVLVLQNVRGSYGSEGAGTYDPHVFDSDINDSYDTVEWIAAQKWSNGKVGMWGPSGHGIAACNALWALPPHLTVVDVNVTGDNAYLHWTFLNGARRYEYSWLAQRGLKTSNNEWPRPTTVSFDLAAYHEFIKSKAPKIKTYYRMNGGWYDIFSEAALDHFAALAPYGRAYAQIGAGGHGPLGGDLVFKARNNLPAAAYKSSRGLKECLAGEPDAKAGSCLAYILMGDPRDPSAPGNVWMTSDKWPVDHKAVSYYMHADGTLSPKAPTDKNASLGYTYDPKNPVPSLGGNYRVGSAKNSPIGPLDQRPQADRKDILRFKTAPLAEPVGITGKVWAELHVSSDCPDTMFVARLVDIYPDGYEALVREGAMLARYYDGLNKPAALEKGKVYKLSMDMWSTALVFNKGHRIALYVTSSSDPAFEVHPNTYEQVGSIDEARVAANTIHLSADHASKLILPVVPQETYINVGRR